MQSCWIPEHVCSQRPAIDLALLVDDPFPEAFPKGCCDGARAGHERMNHRISVDAFYHSEFEEQIAHGRLATCDRAGQTKDVRFALRTLCSHCQSASSIFSITSS